MTASDTIRSDDTARAPDLDWINWIDPKQGIYTTLCFFCLILYLTASSNFFVRLFRALLLACRFTDCWKFQRLLTKTFQIQITMFNFLFSAGKADMMRRESSIQSSVLSYCLYGPYVSILAD